MTENASNIAGTTAGSHRGGWQYCLPATRLLTGISPSVFGTMSIMGRGVPGSADDESQLEAWLGLLSRSAHGGTSTWAYGSAGTAARPIHVENVTNSWHRIWRDLLDEASSWGRGSEDLAYLFEEPLPETVPLEWVAEVQAIRVREDPSFAYPWDEDDN